MDVFRISQVSQLSACGLQISGTQGTASWVENEAYEISSYKISVQWKREQTVVLSFLFLLCVQSIFFID